ncbi:protein LATERAL BRANCHING OXIDOREDUCTASE 1-like isoform X1 [Tasmannia lanceolata]|uniref:protein LATERAL BRANCHING OXIDOREDUCTASE 1-like isoform X1 n=1 Tax=Tasmannia lanceolata TaxID=3420 RepID=UPI0040649696
MGFEVDTAFVQPIEHRPKLTILEAGGIPLIDLSVLNSENSDDPRALSGLIADIEAALREWGFFQVINHGVSSELRRRIETAQKKFFHLALEEKHKIRRDMVNPLGYYDAEHTNNVRDWKEVFVFIVHDETVIPALDETENQELEVLRNRWPEFPPEFRQACSEYGRAVKKLAFKLVELISLSLGLPEKRLNDLFKDNTGFVRLNHYPPCPSPHLALGLSRHSDSGALTVLAQDDVGGLEVKRKTDGEWIRVKPIPDAYIINVGTIIQVWSNDKYESPEHRVVANSERERFSMPFFLNPADYLMVKPLEELVDEQNPPKYREYNCGEFFKSRKNSNFKNLGVENLQISHFKI